MSLFVPENISFPEEGISMEGVKDFIDKCGGRPAFTGLSTDQVCENLVKPMTEEMRSSYVYKLKTNESAGFVGKATVFISHAWLYNFLDVIDALSSRFVDSEGVFIWFDIFTNNQHVTATLPFDWWRNTFMGAISNIGHTIVILSPWKDPIPFTRAWCLWEIFCTAETESKFEVLMSQSERMNFTEEFLRNFESVNQMTATVDTRKAKARSDLDRERIFAAVESGSGFDHVNSVIFNRMRKWLLDSALQGLADSTDDTETRSWKTNIARLLRSQGKLREAVPYYREVYEECLARFGQDSAVTLSSMNNLALNLKMMGELVI